MSSVSSSAYRQSCSMSTWWLRSMSKNRHLNYSWIKPRLSNSITGCVNQNCLRCVGINISPRSVGTQQLGIIGMNGFIFCNRGMGGPISDPQRVAPIVKGSKHDLRHFRTGESLLTWGHDCGDVLWVEQGENAILILSGYITEFKSGPEFSSQTEAGRYLLEQFLGTGSIETLKCVLSRTYGSFGLVFRDQAQKI